VGGGPVGSSTALHLAELSPKRRILVIERDSSYRIASASLSAGGIRQQFSLPENIKMSIYGAEFIKSAAEKLAVPGTFHINEVMHHCIIS
jgi:FAD-dependent oxidoreductase domain-containing protein 1